MPITPGKFDKEVDGVFFRKLSNGDGGGRERYQRLSDGEIFEADCETPYSISVQFGTDPTKRNS